MSFKKSSPYSGALHLFANPVLICYKYSGALHLILTKTFFEKPHSSKIFIELNIK